MTEMNILRNEIDLKIRDFYKFNSQNFSLYVGDSGYLLYDLMSAKTENDVNLLYDRFVNYYKNPIDLYPTYCSGLSGILWTLDFFQNKYEIDNEYFDFMSSFDDYLFDNLIKYLELKNYDFLHGAIGIGFYFYKRALKDNRYINYLKRSVELLNKCVVCHSANSYKWEFLLDQSDDADKTCFSINLGLSHGMASVISYLSKLMKFKDQIPELNQLLLGSINYMIDNVLNEESSKSLFPAVIREKGQNRDGNVMTWCHGDLGILISLYNAGFSLNDKSLIDFVLLKLKAIAENVDNYVNEISYAGICHGASGCALMFHRMYLNTNEEIYKTASIFWLKEILKYSKSKKGLKSFDHEKGWIDNFTLLDGIIGVGLVFSTILGEIDPEWDECLLLS